MIDIVLHGGGLVDAIHFVKQELMLIVVKAGV
jgi:hypothetical protein